ncbi:MAG: sigma 54-interacting transcriptional regulator [Proteobacteria bacterium]|nr:sigma 54-interacting transcriptional regulator [Pseudomonadota bacterium]MBU1583689.1 sigma 54-interacting transcriptional regulator [Pseudomonadota bacterium]MBU2452382.1 sigma 54-interacting transcriptional regulator [Pseudomonadota bacterium]MBU2630187.1 sigma 54-interacting transcriptional regulator [Pseudomonadota bacterium]
MKKAVLTSKEHHFFKTVYNAAFANPFSDLREKLDIKIAGLFPSASRREGKDLCIKEVARQIKKLENQGRADINAFHGPDKDIITIVFLFDIFHKFRDDFDRLIENQLKAGDTPVTVPFAKKAMHMLHTKGFDEKSVSHYFALSYQLRRAFYFISNLLVGSSPCMKKLKKHLWYNVFTYNIDLYDKFLWNKMEDFSTLLLGETGTGKGTAAKAIGSSGYIPFDIKKHSFTQSFTQAFSSLNLSQYPETLLESELFGHTKGAFTGAVDDYQGVFDRCSPHGSILLDEIGEIPNHVQIKLLRVLQERSFSPVGTHEISRFNGRVIAATNRPKKDILNGKVFRDDFYYRLCSDIIEVPPLSTRIKEKPSELDDLLAFTIQKMTGTHSEKLILKVKRIIDRELGKNYQWPGNVRELEQCVRSVLLRRDYKGKQKDEDKTVSLAQELIQGIKDQDILVPSLVSGYCRLLYDKLGTYERVAKQTGLDRRTVKKHIMNFKRD